MFMITSVLLYAPPGGGSGGGGTGAPIDGGAAIFLGVIAAYAYRKLKGRNQ